MQAARRFTGGSSSDQNMTGCSSICTAPCFGPMVLLVLTSGRLSPCGCTDLLVGEQETNVLCKETLDIFLSNLQNGKTISWGGVDIMPQYDPDLDMLYTVSTLRNVFFGISSWSRNGCSAHLLTNGYSCPYPVGGKKVPLEYFQLDMDHAVGDTHMVSSLIQL